MRRTTRFGFIVLWAAVAVGALVTGVGWPGDADFIGVVENRTHKLGAPEGGRVRQVLVSLGDEVEAHQLLAVLDMSDLEHERDWVQAELKDLEVAVAADRTRYGLEYERLVMQGSASEAGLRERRADVEARRGELAALNARIQRLEEAERAGLGRARDLDDLVVRRDAAARFVREAGAALRASAPAALRPAEGPAPTAEEVVLSMMSRRLERVSELKLQLKIVQDNMERRKLYSPSRGHVVKIDAVPGDVVDEFIPFLNIEEPYVAFLDVYIPETADFLPRLGQRVRVVPHRTGAPDARGTIVFIDPGYAAVPERLAFRGMVYWARKFRVRLDDGHGMMPGEAAKVEVLSEFVDASLALAAGQGGGAPVPVALRSPVPGPAAAPVPAPPPAPAAATPSPGGPGPQPLAVPDDLRGRSRFEPSGLAWLPDLDRYLVASDDTSREGKGHAPWLFLVDRQGRVEPEPLVVEGAPALNDVEAIALRPDGGMYLVASQGLSRKGKRPASRRQIFQVERTGRALRVTGSVDFVDVLSRTLDEAGRAALGLPPADAGLEALEIEGAAFHQGALLLGLKTPRPADGALLWRLQDPDALVQENTLGPGDLELAARVDLRTRDGRPAAFSDLAVDAKGGLWATATVPDPGQGTQEGGLFRLDATRDGGMAATPVRSFPGLKPEGLCAAGDGGLMLVFDTDDQPPFLFLKTEPMAP